MHDLTMICRCRAAHTRPVDVTVWVPANGANQSQIMLAASLIHKSICVCIQDERTKVATILHRLSSSSTPLKKTTSGSIDPRPPFNFKIYQLLETKDTNAKKKILETWSSRCREEIQETEVRHIQEETTLSSPFNSPMQEHQTHKHAKKKDGRRKTKRKMKLSELSLPCCYPWTCA